MVLVGLPYPASTVVIIKLDHISTVPTDQGDQGSADWLALHSLQDAAFRICAQSMSVRVSESTILKAAQHPDLPLRRTLRQSRRKISGIEQWIEEKLYGQGYADRTSSWAGNKTPNWARASCKYRMYCVLSSCY
jgi:hypothetical protein